jgi:hypothetical protein
MFTMFPMKDSFACLHNHGLIIPIGLWILQWDFLLNETFHFSPRPFVDEGPAPIRVLIKHPNGGSGDHRSPETSVEAK